MTFWQICPTRPVCAWPNASMMYIFPNLCSYSSSHSSLVEKGSIPISCTCRPILQSRHTLVNRSGLYGLHGLHMHCHLSGQMQWWSFPKSYVGLIVSHLPGGHLPPPKFGHLPPPNSDIYHPQKPYICQEDNCHPQFFSSFLAHFSWLFRLTAHGGHQRWEGEGAWRGGHGAHHVEGAW